MIESPLIEELLARNSLQTTQQNTLDILEGRFGVVPTELAAATRLISDERLLRKLPVRAALCPDIETFQAQMQQ